MPFKLPRSKTNQALENIRGREKKQQVAKFKQILTAQTTNGPKFNLYGIRDNLNNLNLRELEALIGLAKTDLFTKMLELDSISSDDLEKVKLYCNAVLNQRTKNLLLDLNGCQNVSQVLEKLVNFIKELIGLNVNQADSLLHIIKVATSTEKYTSLFDEDYNHDLFCDFLNCFNSNKNNTSEYILNFMSKVTVVTEFIQFKNLPSRFRFHSPTSNTSSEKIFYLIRALRWKVISTKRESNIIYNDNLL